MTPPIVGPPPDDPSAAQGHSYAGLFANADRDSVLQILADCRFTGWLGPQEDAWVLAVAEQPQGAVAGGGTALTTLAVELARELDTVVLVARVERDRVLRLDGWNAMDDDDREEPEHLGSYVSDPTADAPDDDDSYPEPFGSWFAPAYAEACGVPQAADELTEVLAEELDPDSVFESERLDSVLRLLDLPRWLISAQSLPGDVPAGPRRAELTRLGAGREGVPGRVVGVLTGVVRKRRRPPRGSEPPRPIDPTPEHAERDLW